MTRLLQAPATETNNSLPEGPPNVTAFHSSPEIADAAAHVKPSLDVITQFVPLAEVQSPPIALATATNVGAPNVTELHCATTVVAFSVQLMPSVYEATHCSPIATNLLEP